MKEQIIRGRPLYLYKGRQYLDMPPGCVIKRIEYEDNSNKCLVYCKKPAIIVELLCLCIIIGCVIVNILYLHHAEYNVYYNSLTIHYDDKLYLNLHNDENNLSSVTVDLVGGNEVINSFVLNPGDTLVSIPMPSKDVLTEYELVITYNSILVPIARTVTVTVLKK